MQASMQAPLFGSKISVTDFNRPQTLASAILFRNYGGHPFTACRMQGGPGGHQRELAGKRTTLAIVSLLEMGRKQRCLGSHLAPAVHGTYSNIRCCCRSETGLDL